MASPRDLAHEVERGAGDGGVEAQGMGFGHRHRGGPQPADHSELPGHVVGLGQQLALGWAADHGPPAGPVDQQVGQVGVPALQLHPLQRRGHRLTLAASHASTAGRSYPGVPPSPAPVSADALIPGPRARPRRGRRPGCGTRCPCAPVLGVVGRHDVSSRRQAPRSTGW